MTKNQSDEHSRKPFGEAVRTLMSTHDLTFRELAERTRTIDGRGITHSHLNLTVNGRDRPTVRVMELVARACGVDPEHFAEYRLQVEMRALDPNEVGFEQALDNLDACLCAPRRRRRSRLDPASGVE